MNSPLLASDALVLSGVRTHNLKSLDLVLPHNRFYVLTGVSGSGKSSLAFDTLYAEGQRRYVESLSSYARQFLERMEKPDVDKVSGIRPALAIEAKNVITNARSTVGTQTEINDYLRVLFSRMGVTMCPDCGVSVTSSRSDSIADFLIQEHADQRCELSFELAWPKNRKKSERKIFIEELSKQGFSEFWEGEEYVAADDFLKSEFEGERLRVLADQWTISADERSRMLESLDLALRYGKGDVRVCCFKKGESARGRGREFQFSEQIRCFSCGKSFRKPVPNLFSFNSPLGACSACQGFGRIITVDWDLVIPDPRKSLGEGAIEPWTKPGAAWEKRQMTAFCRKRDISLETPWEKLPPAQRKLILFGEEGLSQKEYFSVRDFFQYLEKKTYKMHVRIFLAKYRHFIPCTDCGETRLKSEALCVKIEGRNIFEMQSMPLAGLFSFFKELKIPAEMLKRVEPVYLEILRRLEFLVEVGLGYLTLSRLSRTLSGGEVQRIHLATSLGSALVDTLYVLDEPSIGLHERDNQLLIRLLRKLRDLGNTVVVVEHDRAMIEAADEVLDLGPGGGEKGGELIFQGPVEELKKDENSLTGRFLSGRETLERSASGKKEWKKWIRIRGAAEHNLKGVDLDFPLGAFVAMTGVSGSGKSTLLYHILYRHYERFRGRPVQDLGTVQSIQGFESVPEIVLIDQSPIGRTPRSNPATYIKAFEDVRKIFSQLPESKRRGFGPGHFSFNVEGGRCPSCQGDGRVKVEMHFLADVFVLCEACHGKRFKPEILEVRCRGKSIDDILEMTIDQVADFFPSEKKLTAKLQLLQEVGLGYLKFGQPATTLSGGEAQRLKLAAEIEGSSAEGTLYLFDEPTTGLHYHDIRYLVRAMERLLARGKSILVIEHNLEFIRLADWIIDLGPEGGDQGGKVLYSGPLAGIAKVKASHTGRLLGERGLLSAK